MRTMSGRTAVLVCAVVGSLLAGCTSAGTSSSGTADVGGLAVLTPPAKSEVEQVTWNVFAGEPNTLDPFQSTNYTPNMINANLCETLLVQNPDTTITPHLATSVQNPDPLHWIYNLRSGVSFWDGSPMTAEDVAWSLNHNLSDVKLRFHYLYSAVEKIVVTGPHQVTVTMNRPDYLFNNAMASFAGVVVEKKFYLEHVKDFGTPDTGVQCSGPFKFEHWDRGQSVTEARNTAYWNPTMVPKVKRLVFTFLTDDAAITSALLNGQVDGAYNVPLSGLTRLERSTAGKLYYGPGRVATTFTYSNPGGPMKNPKLRRALQLAIDWNGLAKVVYQGHARTLRGQMSPTIFGAGWGALRTAYDALPALTAPRYEDATKLVEQAGPDAGTTITMMVPSLAVAQQFGLAVEDAAKRIGLKLQLRVVPTGQFGAALFDPSLRRGVDLLYAQFFSNIADPLDWIGLSSSSRSPFNSYGYTGIDKLFFQALATGKPADRAGLATQIQAKLNADLLPMVPGVAADNTLWMNNRITGAPAVFSYLFSPWAASLGGP